MHFLIRNILKKTINTFMLINILCVCAQDTWIPYSVSDDIQVYFPDIPNVARVDSIATDVISYKTDDELFLVTVGDITFDKELDSIYYHEILNKYIHDMAEGNILLNNISGRYKGMMSRYFKIKSLQEIDKSILTENQCFIIKGKVICISYWDLSHNKDNILRCKAFFDKTYILQVPTLDQADNVYEDKNTVQTLPQTNKNITQRLPFLILLILLVVGVIYLLKYKHNNKL